MLIVSVLISACLWFILLRRYDRIRREPLKIVLKVGLLGGLLSVLFAGTLNGMFYSIVGDGDFLLSVVLGNMFVGLNEEFMKFFFTLLLIKRLKQFDEPIDGVVYATSVALGFAFFENIEYGLDYGVGNVVMRTLTATPLHLGTAAIWGYGLAKARFLPDRKFLSTSLPFIFLAAAVHALYNISCEGLGAVSSPVSVLVALGFGLTLFIFIHKRLIFLNAQSPFIQANQCARCGKHGMLNAKFCQYCGEKFEHEFFNVCHKCNTKLLQHDHYCWRCGTKVGSTHV